MKYVVALVAALAATSVSARPRGRGHTVIVGGDELRYTPDEVFAQPGDWIKFVFQKANHTVTESTFRTPCKNAHGFDTDFVPNKENVTPGPVRHLKDLKRGSRYFYCRQSTHCGKGMVLTVHTGLSKEHVKRMGRDIESFRQRAIEQNGGKVAPKPTHYRQPEHPQLPVKGDDLFSEIFKNVDTKGNFGMTIDYASNGYGNEGNGADLSGVDTSKVPRFALCGSCGNSPGRKSIIAMIDVDAAKPRLMYLRKNFTTNVKGHAPEDLVAVDNAEGSKPEYKPGPFIKYMGPETTKQTYGKDVHRYVFLQIDQPTVDNFEFKPVDEENFDLAGFYRDNNLKVSRSATHFVAKVGSKW